MTDDLRHQWRVAASLTVLGLMADLGYLAVEAAARFSLIHQWAEAAAFFAVGLVATMVAAHQALARAVREAERGH